MTNEGETNEGRMKRKKKYGTENDKKWKKKTIGRKETWKYRSEEKKNKQMKNGLKKGRVNGKVRKDIRLGKWRVEGRIERDGKEGKKKTQKEKKLRIKDKQMQDGIRKGRVNVNVNNR